MKKIIAFLLFACALNAGPRLAHSTFYSKQGAFLTYDKLEHLSGSFLLCSGFRVLGVSNKNAVVTSLTLGFAWEVKDAFMPREKYGPIGAEGFCWRDLTADAVGVFASYLVNKYVLN
jgi:hypothetical protein